MKRHAISRWAAATAGCLLAGTAWAEPVQIAAQGRLTSGAGPVADGTYALSIALYPQAQGGNPVFEEPFLAVPIQAGVFSIVLGSPKYPLDSAVFAAGGPLWVAVTVGADELPRVPLTRSPFAIHALVAKAAQDIQCTGCIGEADLAKGAVTGDKIAAGAVGANHTSFNWAASDAPGGPAMFAVDANKAKLAEAAKNAETAAFADEAGAAKGLMCTGCVKAAHLATDALDWKKLQNVPAGFADGIDDSTSATEIVAALAKNAPDLAPGTKIAGAPAARILSTANASLGSGKSLLLDSGSKSPGVQAQAWFLNPADNTWILAAAGDQSVFGTCSDCGNGADGVFNPQSNANLSTSKKWQFTELLIPKGVVVTVTGSAALEIKATKRIQIDGTLVLDGGNSADSQSGSNGCSPNNGQSSPGAAGPGGHPGGTSTYGVWTSTAGGGPGGGAGAGDGNSYGNGGGGGGGGYGSGGSTGAKAGATTTQGPGGAGGGTYAGIANGQLIGGSGGGGGGYGSAYNAAGTGGGGGGGAAKLEAPEIVVTGKISANGGSGGKQTLCDGGGGGGGSGGAIWLRAAKVDFATGTLTAKGGQGGAIDLPSGADGGIGGAGGDGLIRVDSPGAIAGTSAPAFFKGDAAGLSVIGGNHFAFDQVAPGVVRLTNKSGSPQSVVLVVTF
ncbi:MAG: hypothetical protein FJ100_15825 [Deltaproteobacteria bacterium]|nr:hypothetical protein [Deltaproteobacteria bacterium]